MRTDRLMRTAENLRGLPHEKFNYALLVEERSDQCGTICCAVGWLPEWDPDNWEWRELKADPEDGVPSKLPRLKCSEKLGLEGAQQYFELSREDTRFLFHPMYNDLGSEATPQQVAKHIEKFVAERNIEKFVADKEAAE